MLNKYSDSDTLIYFCQDVQSSIVNFFFQKKVFFVVLSLLQCDKNGVVESTNQLLV